MVLKGIFEPFWPPVERVQIRKKLSLKLKDLIDTLLTRYKPFSGKLSSSSNRRLCVFLTGGQFELSSWGVAQQMSLSRHLNNPEIHFLAFWWFGYILATFKNRNIGAFLASPVTKSILYRSRHGPVKTKGSVDLELRTRVTEMEVCTISFENHLKK